MVGKKMSKLFKPALGPIVGHTTDTSCRLWIAAYPDHDENDISNNIRTVGVIGVAGTNGKVAAENIWYFRLRRQYHRTGVYTLGKDVNLWADENERKKLKPFLLKPATRYLVRMAYLEISLPSEEMDGDASEEVVKTLPPARVWVDQLNDEALNAPYVTADFTTQPKFTAAARSIKFLFGSCRNNWFNGVPFYKKKESDLIFKAMYEKHSDANFVLMVGDQIYADSASVYVPAFKADTYKEFEEAYHENYKSLNFRRLTSHIPTYMILDDHEIEDNWTQDRVNKNSDILGHFSNRCDLFNCAMSAYMSYQWIHGPRFSDSYIHQRKDKLIGSEKYLAEMDVPRLYYDFNCGGYPFFVLDTRTSRYKNGSNQRDDDDINNNHLLGLPSKHPTEPSQLDRLCAWLIHMQEDYGNRPKFIVSSGVFVPNEIDTAGDGFWSRRNKDNSDTWTAFPQTRNQVLKTLLKHNIENVIFLSGDIHCTNICEIEINGIAGEKIHAWSVTSSPFYWPYTFINGETAKYIRNSVEENDSFDIYETLLSNPQPGTALGTMNYQSWGYTQNNNFARVDIDAEKQHLKVQFFDTDGNPIPVAKRDGDKNSRPEIITLTPWS